MRIGLIIAVVIVVIVGLSLFVVGGGGTVERATPLSAEERLQPATLPADLPEMFTPSEDAQANATYEELVFFVYDNRRDFDQSPPAADALREAIDLLVEAMEAERVADGLLNDAVPLTPMADPIFGDALYLLTPRVVAWARDRHEAGDTEQAEQAVLALWAFGQRLFEHSDRMTLRWTGLQMMRAAGGPLFEWQSERDEQAAEAFRAWGDAFERVEASWQDKQQKVLRSVKPQIGDLLRMAEAEQDRSLRVEAVLALGIAKFNPGSRANERAIEAAIEAAKNDDDPLIAEAGQAAEEFPVEELRKLN